MSDSIHSPSGGGGKPGTFPIAGRFVFIQQREVNGKEALTVKAWYIREQKHICGHEYAEVDLFEISAKEHTASTRRKKELATSIAQQKYNDAISRRYFCQLAYTNFTRRDWAFTFTYNKWHHPAAGDFDRVDKDWSNFTKRMKRYCKKKGIPAPKWMQVAEYCVLNEDGTSTGRHHHHVILEGTLTREEVEMLWRDSSGEEIGMVHGDHINLTSSNFEALTRYMTKARARVRRWRQSRGLKAPQTPRPNDTRWSRKGMDDAFSMRVDDREFWERKFPGYTLRECEQHITGNNTKHLIVKLQRKPEPRRKNRRNQP